MSNRLLELRNKYGLTEYKFSKIKFVDPTPTFKFLPWLLSVFHTKTTDGYKLNESLTKPRLELIKNHLEWFIKNLNGTKIPVNYRDINVFKTVDEFISRMNELSTPSISELKSQVRLVLDDENFKILVPLSFQSSQLYGSGTKWCTTTKTYYDNYTKDGILYYIIDKRTNRKFGLPVKISGLNFNSASFYNNEDKLLRLKDIHGFYGESFFSVVIKSITEDYKSEIVKIKKRKALKEAITKITNIKKDLNVLELSSEETVLDELLNKLNGMSIL